MIILALDPGEETGYAKIEIDGLKDIKVIDYGTIPVINPGIDGLLDSVWLWLHRETPPGKQSEITIVFEDFIPSSRLRTSREAAEVRGIIRLFCIQRYLSHRRSNHWASYQPATVRAQLSVANKKGARLFVERVLGFKVKGKDHVPDAFAVALCHAIKTGTWIPHIDCSQPMPERGAMRNGREIDPSTMMPEELRAAINSGKVRVGK
jgi:Holliday junction resolvasome RuvABC endonuclease subunit